MISRPRFIPLLPFGLAWGIIPLIILTGAPLFLRVPVTLIQIVNTFSVALMPVRVSIIGGQVECYFPLAGKTKIFDLVSAERYFQRNPIRVFRFSDSLVLRSPSGKVQIWRMGTKGFDGICDSLKAVNS